MPLFQEKIVTHPTNDPKFHYFLELFPKSQTRLSGSPKGLKISWTEKTAGAFFQDGPRQGGAGGHACRRAPGAFGGHGTPGSSHWVPESGGRCHVRHFFIIFLWMKHLGEKHWRWLLFFFSFGVLRQPVEVVFFCYLKQSELLNCWMRLKTGTDTIRSRDVDRKFDGFQLEWMMVSVPQFHDVYIDELRQQAISRVFRCENWRGSACIPYMVSSTVRHGTVCGPSPRRLQTRSKVVATSSGKRS